VAAGDRGGEAAGDFRGGDAVRRRLVGIDLEDPALRRSVVHRVDLGEVMGVSLLQPFLERVGSGEEFVVIHAGRTVHLGGHGRQHRRTGRNFDDVHHRVEPPRDRLHPVPQPERDFVRRHLPGRLGNQIDADVGVVGRVAHPVMAHHPVEVDRRSDADIALEIEHLVLFFQITFERRHQRRGLFDGRSGRHFDHELQFVAVVVGEHF